MIDPEHKLSITRQAELVNISRGVSFPCELTRNIGLSGCRHQQVPSIWR